ncbi:MAG: hypothetical protein O3B21_08680 [Proteobacteria bacterium]|nr:hypothetical protein [Pseudomonadota bacterium]MDA1357390.1 hypothetical protein [Pseudomonadota bacterium]
MAQITKELVLAQAREFGGTLPAPARAEELAATLNVLIGALDQASEGLALEAEPSNMARALDELAGD